MPDQNIMDPNDPGLRERARQTNATLRTVLPDPRETNPSQPINPNQKVDRVRPKAIYGTQKGEKRFSDAELKAMTKPLPSYKDGTNFVPNTGPAELHKGEAVVTAEENPHTKVTGKGKNMAAGNILGAVGSIVQGATSGKPQEASQSWADRRKKDLMDKNKKKIDEDVDKLPINSRTASQFGMKSYKKGTNYVPKTGPAILHTGEKVVPAEENPFSKIVEGTKKPAPKKTLKSIHTHRAHDGSYIHKHEFHHMDHTPEEHTSPDMAGALAHLAEHAPNMEAQQPEETPEVGQ